MKFSRHRPRERSVAPIEKSHMPELGVPPSPDDPLYLAAGNAPSVRADTTGPASRAHIAARGAGMKAQRDRATVRVAVAVSAEVIPLHRRNRVYSAETLDVSPTGARFLLRVQLPAGTPVRFRCQLPGRRQPVSIDVEATIQSHSRVPVQELVLARDLYLHCADFSPLEIAVEDAIVSALLFIETRCA
jgi:hypothetical protein